MTRALRLVLAPAAARDIREEGVYLTLHGSEKIADRFVDSVSRTGRLLCSNPKAGRVFRDATKVSRELRSFPLSGAFSRRLIVYSVGRGTLRVERVIHGSRNLSEIFSA